MDGLTNAMGATHPELEQALTAFGHGQMELREELRAQIIELQTGMRNPKLGETVHYAGFDWIACHVDYGNEAVCLALKNIYHLASYSDESVPGHPSVNFGNSVMGAEVHEFEYLLRSREDANLKLLEEIFYDGLECKVFIPTREQMSEFDLFKTDAQDMACGNAVALYEGEPMEWWLADSAVSARKPYVQKNGYYRQSAVTSQFLGVRPFVRMKMR